MSRQLGKVTGVFERASEAASVFSLWPFAFAIPHVLSRLSFAFPFAFAFSFRASFSSFGEQQRAASFDASLFAFLRMQLEASVHRVRVSDVFLLSIWSGAGSKRFARFKGQRIPIRFGCSVEILSILAIVIRRLFLITVILYILIQKKKRTLSTFPKSLWVAIRLCIRRSLLLN